MTIYTVLTFALLIIGGTYAGKLAEKFKLPKLIGMIIFGCIIGPPFLGLIDDFTLKISKNLKDIALVTVLLTGGLGISKAQMKKMGRPAILLSFIPAGLEGFAVAFTAVKVFGLSFVQGGILGFIISAVSPAVLIPSMVDLIKRRVGEKKAIPQMLLTGGSADDSIAIAMFTTFLNIYFGSSKSIALTILNVPISLMFGIIIGGLCAVLSRYICKVITNKTLQALIVLVVALIMRWGEHIHPGFSYNSLVGVMAMGYVINNTGKEKDSFSVDVQAVLGKIWSIGQIFLFTLVGAAIDVTLIGNVFVTGSLVILSALILRSIGTWISLIGTDLNIKERLFCVIAYLPKATVQSAKAGVPLQMGVADGGLIQAIAILSVLITAPIGAIGIKLTADKFLEKEIEVKPAFL